MTKEKNTPLVSVLMTVYNREAYIAEAIESVLASSYTNFELIIVDDRSTDQSYAIAQRFAAKDDRIRLYQNEKNLGQFPNRNKAAGYAKGKYIKYLDSDDIIYPHGLEVMVWAIEQFPGAAFATSYPERQPAQAFPIFLTSQQAYQQQFLSKGVMDIGPSATIINKQAFDAVQGFGEDDFVGNDTLLLYHLARNFPIVLMPPALIWWRRHEEQDYQAGLVNRDYLKHIYKIKQATIQHEECPLNSEEKKQALHRLKHHEARHILSAIKRGNGSEAHIRYQAAQFKLTDLLAGLKPY